MPKPSISTWQKTISRIIDSGGAGPIVFVAPLLFIIYKLPPNDLKEFLIESIHSNIGATLGWLLFLLTLCVMSFALWWKDTLHKKEMARYMTTTKNKKTK